MGCGASAPGAVPPQLIVAEHCRRIEVKRSASPDKADAKLSPCGRTKEEARQRLHELGVRDVEDDQIPDKVWAAEVLKLRYELKQQQEETRWRSLALQTAKEHIAILSKKLEEVTDEELEARNLDSTSWRRTFQQYARQVKADIAKAKADHIGHIVQDTAAEAATQSEEGDRERKFIDEQRRLHQHKVQQELEKAEEIFGLGVKEESGAQYDDIAREKEAAKEQMKLMSNNSSSGCSSVKYDANGEEDIEQAKARARAQMQNSGVESNNTTSYIV